MLSAPFLTIFQGLLDYQDFKGFRTMYLHRNGAGCGDVLRNLRWMLLTKCFRLRPLMSATRLVTLA